MPLHSREDMIDNIARHVGFWFSSVPLYDLRLQLEKYNDDELEQFEMYNHGDIKRWAPNNLDLTRR